MQDDPFTLLIICCILVGIMVVLKILELYQDKKIANCVDKILSDPRIRYRIEEYIHTKIKENIDLICGKREPPIKRLIKRLRGGK
ncbi:MAG: hypothetical protein DRO40_06635 [Thermoprotei archaeon]|nr:MAG: hypothetical protein DRO40_06635 [Thermoprotei archaeon]